MSGWRNLRCPRWDGKTRSRGLCSTGVVTSRGGWVLAAACMRTSTDKQQYPAMTRRSCGRETVIPRSRAARVLSA